MRYIDEYTTILIQLLFRMTTVSPAALSVANATKNPRAAAALRKKVTPEDLVLGGSLVLQQGGCLLGGSDRIALLEAIHETGSMSRAAKVVGISYVTAWDRIQDMNNATGQALVHRTAGGSGGGGTVLTPYALELITAFRHIEQVHKQVLQQLSQSLSNPGNVFQTLSRLGLRTSARNQLAGTVTRVRAGAMDAWIELSLPGAAPGETGDTLRVSLTTASLKTLGVKKGMQAVALLKAPAVHLARPGSPEDPSMHNRLRGQVTAMHIGPAHAEVHVRLRGGQTLVSKADHAQLTVLQLSEGAEVLVQFHDHAIVLGVV